MMTDEDGKKSDPALAAKVEAAGRDLVAFMNSDLPAARLAEFVANYFPRLQARPHGDDLEITNHLGDTQFVRRMPILYHGGIVRTAGTQRFQTSALIALLDASQGIERDFRQLVEHLARFNNRRP
jgi:hypothetical protein